MIEKLLVPVLVVVEHRNNTVQVMNIIIGILLIITVIMLARTIFQKKQN